MLGPAVGGPVIMPRLPQQAGAFSSHLAPKAEADIAAPSPAGRVNPPLFPTVDKTQVGPEGRWEFQEHPTFG